MIILIRFAFLAGIVTIPSPCILSILPIVLLSSVDTTGKRRPLGVAAGFVLSSTFHLVSFDNIYSGYISQYGSGLTKLEDNALVKNSWKR